MKKQSLKVVECIRNEIDDWEDLCLKHEYLYSKPTPKLTIGKEYKVLKIDNQGCIVMEDDFGIKQRRSQRYFKQSVKKPKKAKQLSMKKKIIRKLVHFLNGL